MLAVVRDLLLKRRYARAVDRIVMTAGVPWEVSGATNLLKVEVVGSAARVPRDRHFLRRAADRLLLSHLHLRRPAGPAHPARGADRVTGPATADRHAPRAPAPARGGGCDVPRCRALHPRACRPRPWHR